MFMDINLSVFPFLNCFCLNEFLVLTRHALRNALVPAVTVIGLTYGGLLEGSVLTETIFAWPGLGQLAVKALIGVDYPLLQAVVVVFTLMYVIAAMLVDIMYAYIDPRIRYA